MNERWTGSCSYQSTLYMLRGSWAKGRSSFEEELWISVLGFFFPVLNFV